jgi:hypothetical protein
LIELTSSLASPTPTSGEDTPLSFLLARISRHAREAVGTLVLRWLFNLKYFICLPDFNANLLNTIEIAGWAPPTILRRCAEVVGGAHPTENSSPGL